MVPKAGLEPARLLHRQILSLLRLPVSSLGHLILSQSTSLLYKIILLKAITFLNFILR